MKTAAAYIRVSTEEQTELSPDSQIKEIRKYAKAHGYIVPEEYIFVDAGISGRNTAKRPAFNQMIGTAKRKPKPFDTILLWKFSRFARNREDSIVYKSMLRKQCGIDVVSISESLGDDKMSILIEAMIEAMDEYYSINLAEEVTRGMTEKAERGEVVSTPPFGYNVQNNIYIIDEATAPIVKMIYDDFENGLPYLRIAKKLNSMGIKTKRGNPFENRTVEYILRNPVYTGKIIWTPDKSKDRYFNNANSSTIVRQGKHTPIITEEQFNRVQERVRALKSRHKYMRSEAGSYVLKGVVRCGNCGATLARNQKNYMQCIKYTHGTCTVSHSINMKTLENIIIKQIQDDVASQNFKIATISQTDKSENEQITKLIEKENIKLERVKEAYANGIDTLSEYKENKEKIQKQIDKLKAMQAPKQIDYNEIKKKFSNKLKLAAKTLLDENATPETKNEALKTVVSKIILEKPDNEVRMFYYA